MTKTEIRKWMKSQRNSLTTLERSAFNETIIKSFLQTPEYRQCEELFCFVSFGSEVDTHPILLQALIDKKKVYIPRIEENAGMEFYRFERLESLHPSKFGVPEPFPDPAERYDFQDAHHSFVKRFMVLPGLAFDLQGNRIGYGAGYYDKFFEKYNEVYFYKLAVCYDFQLVDPIQAEEYDIKADAILTPTKRIDCIAERNQFQ